MTPGRVLAPTVYAEPYQRQPMPAPEVQRRDAKLALDPMQGPVGTRTLRGEGFPADATLQLVWETYVGSRVSGDGFAPAGSELWHVTVDRDGRIDSP